MRKEMQVGRSHSNLHRLQPNNHRDSQRRKGVEMKESNEEYVQSLERRTVWSHYCRYGIGDYDNWLSMVREHFPKERVIKVLRHPETRAWAEARIQKLEKQVSELRQLMVEAEATARYKCVCCGGTGEVHSHNPKCWDCNGTGVTTREKAEAEIRHSIVPGVRLIDMMAHRSFDEEAFVRKYLTEIQL